MKKGNGRNEKKKPAAKKGGACKIQCDATKFVAKPWVVYLLLQGVSNPFFNSKILLPARLHTRYCEMVISRKLSGLWSEGHSVLFRSCSLSRLQVALSLYSKDLPGVRDVGLGSDAYLPGAHAVIISGDLSQTSHLGLGCLLPRFSVHRMRMDPHVTRETARRDVCGRPYAGRGRKSCGYEVF